MKFYIKLRGSCQSKTDKGNYSEVYYHFGESALSIDVFFKEKLKKKKKKKKKQCTTVLFMILKKTAGLGKIWFFSYELKCSVSIIFFKKYCSIFLIISVSGKDQSILQIFCFVITIKGR